MANGSITLVAGSERTRFALQNQLKEYLYDVVEIKSFATEEGIHEKISDELIVLSSDLVKNELIEMNLLDTDCEIIVANRTINYDYIDQVVLIPKDTDVLFVNDEKETTYEGIRALKELGIDHINFIPYYPYIKESVPKVDIAITPGECDKVPGFVKKVIDIGPRIMDFTTVMQILNKMNMLDFKGEQFSNKYLKKIINVAKKIAELNSEVTNLNKHLNLVLDGLNDGLLVYDTMGKISVFNENLKRLLNVGYTKVIGRSVKDIIYNKSILEFLMNKETGTKVFDNDNVQILANKFYLSKSNYTIVTFKNVKETIEANENLKRELINKGFYAKYTFDDIIGISDEIKRIKQIANKLAKTDLAILIEGESGTGKELFASAIHNASRRKKGPFLAVNFSALPDGLIESELFGYEEGAFTGAKKGGKAGLFEQADGGTIFLDEIGDISMKVQTRLLRVLEEKEVMRIGGNEIKSIDVRIIAATNKNLAQLVNEKKFREDLYYRLKVGYLRLAPLRERKEDIAELIRYFIKVYTMDSVKISDEAIKQLIEYDWYGNVRELINTISYMLAVREGNILTVNDIPHRNFFQKRSNELEKEESNYEEELEEDQIFIMKKIHELNKSGKTAGREKLAKLSEGTDFKMTQYEIRGRLDKLERMGLITKDRGKRGTRLTNKGEKILMNLMAHF